MQSRDLKKQLSFLLEQNHLLSVEQMLELLATTHREFNKTSVYRALDQLEQDGMVCKQYLGASQAVYELKQHHHAHLLCKNCGKVAIVECEVSDPAKVDGFTIDHHHLTFIGTCADCVA